MLLKALPFALLLAAASGAVHAAEDPLVTKGRKLVQRDCAACHAIGLKGASPLPEAPAFRELGRRYDFDGLPLALKTGIAPLMPQFIFSAPDSRALVAYMKSVQAPAKPAATALKPAPVVKKPVR